MVGLSSFVCLFVLTPQRILIIHWNHSLIVLWHLPKEQQKQIHTLHTHAHTVLCISQGTKNEVTTSLLLCTCYFIHQQFSPVATKAETYMILPVWWRPHCQLPIQIAWGFVYQGILTINVLVLDGSGYSLKVFLYIKGAD